MSAAETRAVVDRLATIRASLGWEDFAAYALLALGLLADQAPEVVTFVLDRADALLEGAAS